MVVKKKEGIFGEGEIKPFTKEELETWKWPVRIFLILAIFAFIGWIAFTTPGLNAAVFGANAKTATDIQMGADGKVPSSGKNPSVVGTATPTPTQGKEKNQINMDRKDPILAQRIGNLEARGEKIMPINNLPQEIQIGSSPVYITGLTVNNGVTGFIENRGKKTLFISIDRITFITKDYFAPYLKVIYIDGEYGANAAREFKPGQKKSFGTINTKDADGYKKIGGLPEDLKQLEQVLAQSSYLQINDISISDT